MRSEAGDRRVAMEAEKVLERCGIILLIDVDAEGINEHDVFFVANEAAALRALERLSVIGAVMTFELDRCLVEYHPRPAGTLLQSHRLDKRRSEYEAVIHVVAPNGDRASAEEPALPAHQQQVC